METRQLLASLSLMLLSSSCAVVVGNVKPVDEKSKSYGVMDLSQNATDWIKLDPSKSEERDVSPTEVSDVAYQSKSTASIISLDSACRQSEDPRRQDLKTLTDLLLLGMSDVTMREERGLEVEKTPALETTIQGRLSGEPIRFRTVVLRRDRCVYDLVYMARPQYFERNSQDFSHFVASLKLK